MLCKSVFNFAGIVTQQLKKLEKDQPMDLNVLITNEQKAMHDLFNKLVLALTVAFQ